MYPNICSRIIAVATYRPPIPIHFGCRSAARALSPTADPLKAEPSGGLRIHLFCLAPCLPHLMLRSALGRSAKMAAVGMTVTVQRQKHENGRPAHHANDTATVCDILRTIYIAFPDTIYPPSFLKTHGHPSPRRYARI